MGAYCLLACVRRSSCGGTMLFLHVWFQSCVGMGCERHCKTMFDNMQSTVLGIVLPTYINLQDDQMIIMFWGLNLKTVFEHARPCALQTPIQPDPSLVGQGHRLCLHLACWNFIGNLIWNLHSRKPETFRTRRLKSSPWNLGNLECGPKHSNKYATWTWSYQSLHGPWLISTLFSQNWPPTRTMATLAKQVC